MSGKNGHKKKVTARVILNWVIKKKRENMAKKVTSSKVASKASKVLRDKRTGADSKSAAGSALSQKEKKAKKKK